VKPDAVLKHWAIAKILKSKPTTTGTGPDSELGNDEEVCKVIVEKFKQVGGANVSYAEIAKRAWEAGRTGLATKVRNPFGPGFYGDSREFKLLDYETNASDQVPLLLSMKEDRLALLKAVDSGDTNLGLFWYISSYESIHRAQFIKFFWIYTNDLIWGISSV